MTDDASTTPPIARDPRPALIAAAVVAGVMLLAQLIGLVETLATSRLDPRFFGVSFLPNVFAGILPTAAGVFLLLWLWPVRTGDRLLMVLVKGLLAALAGVLLALVVGYVYGAISAGFSRLTDLEYFAYNPFAGLLSSLVDLAPLVMLVVLVQWVMARGTRL